jgi:hypothetical protein
MSAPFSSPQALAGELLGTYLLVLFGTGSVAAAVLTNAQMGLWQVAVAWGFGVTLAIYASAALSGAHLNLAISLAFALWRRHDFPVARLLPYLVAQLVGAIRASATVAWLFWPFLVRFEATKGLIRGAPGSELSAMILGEYFPNPPCSALERLRGRLSRPGMPPVSRGDDGPADREKIACFSFDSQEFSREKSPVNRPVIESSTRFVDIHIINYF